MCEGSFLPEALVLKPRLPDSIEPSLLSNQGFAVFETWDSGLLRSKQAFQIAGAMENSGNVYLRPSQSVKYQVLWKSRDRGSPHITQFVAPEGAWRPGAGIPNNAQQGGCDRIFPTLASVWHRIAKRTSQLVPKYPPRPIA